MREILDLPHITSANPKKIGEFSEQLTYCVQALQTMKKLNQVDGNVSMTLNKLPAIRGDLVRTDPTWESWDFAKLAEALRQWTRRNPASATSERDAENRKRDRPSKLFQARDHKPRACVYCGDVGHKATECHNVADKAERKQTLAKKKLCFNCALGTHRASECPSKTSCHQSHKRHHTSICDQASEGNNGRNAVLTASGSGEGMFPVLTVKVKSLTNGRGSWVRVVGRGCG